MIKNIYPGSTSIPLLEDDSIELRLTNIKLNGNVIKDLEAYYKFRY